MTKSLKSASQELMSKQMTRKQFLAHVGVGLLALTGIGSAVASMTGSGKNTRRSNTRTVKSGYGGTAYGA